MSLEARVLDAATWFMNTRNETILVLIEKIRLKEIERYEASLKPMTVEELNARADISNENIKNGEVIDIEDMLKEYELTDLIGEK